MALGSNTLKRRGFRDVVFNLNDKSFYSPIEGDNYTFVGKAGSGGGDSGGGGGTGTVTTQDVALVNPSTYSVIPDSSGLTNQKELNEWIYATLLELDKLDGSGSDVNLDGYATEAWVKDQKYITTVSLLPSLPG